MKATHKIKETGVELRESTTNKDVFVKVEDNYHCWHKRDIEMLGLKIEPIVREKKKLYAYRSGTAILFSDVENAKVSGMRAPEFDILYPEE